ncbi:gephyrin-like molybdotransferase Glp [Methyloferula stellata]|uniref:molybdopterin molybdotransferase MoeA n=1 Tax=Methyloferula stellata TaxID=876270 RepID=UPI0003619F77|nr:gephyrin-like molybdotransferase Glp [Methyloferula stellata]
MAQLSKDIFSTGNGPMPVEDAVRLLFGRIPAIAETEPVSLVEAEGRFLAEALTAPIDLPTFDNSAVDGYAVRFDDLKPEGETILPVEGRVAAGHCLDAEALQGRAVRIFTGAPMPAGLDTIFMQEDCKETDAGVSLPSGLSRGANLRLRGEDVKIGEAALPQGRRLRPEDIGLAAALGLDRLTVRRKLKAAVFSTGDEIMSPGQALRPAAVYDANRFVLQSLLKRLGLEVTDLGILEDDPARIKEALTQAAKNHDLVITSGGVSMGEEDHVKGAISTAGSLVFWKLAIKPGRPVAMGVIDGTPFVGLPGNPVAVFITFIYVVRPLIAALNGAPPEPAKPISVTSGFAYKKKEGRREYVRVSLTQNAEGDMIAEKYPVEGAGVLTSLTRTDGLVELPENVTKVAPGDKIGFIDYALIR